MIDVPMMYLATFLPHQSTPYVVLLAIGFVVGAYGQAARFRWLTLAGILIVIVAAVAFQVGSSGGTAAPPGF
ncbi:MAG: hypothetical protein QOJ01_1019 [Solirubrobacterales bacterium]|jgi:hypothetical protein|nr:hypothetical protein [Solirubrobacterales bacterium]